MVFSGTIERGLHLHDDEDLNIVDARYREGARMIVRALIRYSTAIPFKFNKTRQCFNCFFCSTHFNAVKDIRRHTNELHNWNSHINYRFDVSSEAKIYVDATELKCKVCSDQHSSLELAFVHMASHGFINKMNVLDVITPFYGSERECTKCKKDFNNFEQLIYHSNNAHLSSVTATRTAKTLNLMTNTRNTLNLVKRKNVASVIQNSTAMPFRRHSGRYMCYFCPKKYIQVYDLKNCCKNNWSNTKLTQYVRNVELLRVDITDLSCRLCLLKTENIRNLISHLNSMHGLKISDGVDNIFACYRLSDDSLNCVDCGASFDNFIKLSNHYEMDHMSGMKYPCGLCGQIFNNKNTLRTHVLVVHSKAKHKCQYCYRRFDSTSRKQRHEISAHKLKCEQCELEFSSRERLNKHLISAHGIWKTVFECDICNQKFRLKCRLLKHTKRTHSKEKTIMCTECGAAFFDEIGLRLHMATVHVAIKNFDCDFCSKKFNTKSKLTRHKKIHTK